MPTSTVEDYLKAILLEEQVLPSGRLVTMGQIATSLEVAPGTVTAMVKTLEKLGLVSYEPYSGVRLSEEGRHEAIHVLRRHRLIELFLVEVKPRGWRTRSPRSYSTGSTSCWGTPKWILMGIPFPTSLGSCCRKSWWLSSKHRPGRS